MPRGNLASSFSKVLRVHELTLGIGSGAVTVLVPQVRPQRFYLGFAYRDPAGP